MSRTCRSLPVRLLACLLLAVLADRVRAQDEPPAAPVRVPTVNLKDRGIEDQAPVRSRSENGMEFNAYYDALITAHAASSAGFAKGARRDLSYVNVFEEPARYRGDILHIEGRLYRVRKLGTAEFVHDLGLNNMYEGWIYTAGDGVNYPWCVVFTNLSPGIKVGEKMNVPVTFDGFFFKRYRYHAGSGKVRDCPLLIGHAPVAAPQASAAAGQEHWPTLVIVGLAGLVGTTITLVVVLSWWYRRSDQRLRSRLVAANGSTFAEPGSREQSDEQLLPEEEDGTAFHEV